MNVPYYVEVRHRIESVEDVKMRMLLKAIYLFGAKISEMTGKKYPKDKQAPPTILGPTGNDVRLYEFEIPNHKQYKNAGSSTDNFRGVKGVRTDKSSDEVERAITFAVFRLNFEEGRSKRNEQRERYVALPISNKYEPWTKGLYEYFIDAGDKYVFPLYRQDAQAYVKREKVFEGLTYPIEYSMYGHAVDYQKGLGMDGLRLVRMVELSTKHGFEPRDMDAYGIWKLRGKGVHEQVLGVGKKDSDPWKRYIWKLCRQRNIAYICKNCGYIEFSE